MMQRCDVAVVGGGLVGLATALAVGTPPPWGLPRSPKGCSFSVVVLEGEDSLSKHQSGHNSGVIHSGLYYRPGSAKAQTCTEGRDLLYRFCEAEGIRHERCGKVVVATLPEELPRLDELERRGRANGLPGLVRLTAEEIREREPYAAGIAGLWVPTTGIVDYGAVAARYAHHIQQAGGEVRTGTRVIGVQRRSHGGDIVLETTSGTLACRRLVGCAGLWSDRLARLCGLDPGVRIVPFRGEYQELKPEKRYLVRNLIYPVPDPRFPFLGVHFTRTVDGVVEAGPNAVLALARDGYHWSRIVPKDLLETLTYPGFLKLATRYWRIGIGEVHRSWSRRAFVKALQRLLPDLQTADVDPHGAGVRAQAVDPKGNLLDDFHIVRAPGMVHVLNAPSPGATASMAIGRRIAGMLDEA